MHPHHTGNGKRVGQTPERHAPRRAINGCLYLRSPCVSPLQGRNIDLVHLEHRFGDPFRLLLVLVLHHLHEDRRDYLP